MISAYTLCFIIGFGGVLIFSILFFTGYWAIGKIHQSYLNWKNPWRDLESLINN